jgi:hypothetical protein
MAFAFALLLHAFLKRFKMPEKKHLLLAVVCGVLFARRGSLEHCHKSQVPRKLY